jgi:hypothetical protein
VKIFSLLFGAIYYASVWQVDWALFYYYPETNKFYLTAHPDDGAAILWYGWLATAALVSVPLALLVPRRIADRVSNELLWLIPVGAIVAIFYHESRWFL